MESLPSLAVWYFISLLDGFNKFSIIFIRFEMKSLIDYVIGFRWTLIHQIRYTIIAFSFVFEGMKYDSKMESYLMIFTQNGFLFVRPISSHGGLH